MIASEKLNARTEAKENQNASGTNPLLLWLSLNTNSGTLAQRVYDITPYIVLNAIEIALGTYEKLYLRLREVSILKIAQKGLLSVRNNSSAVASLATYQSPFRRAVSIYLIISLAITATKAGLRYFKNKTFIGLQDNRTLSHAEEEFERTNSPDSTEFDNERASNTLPESAKSFYGLIQKIAFLLIDIYIFYQMLNPILSAVVFSALGVAAFITKVLATPEAAKKSEAKNLSNTYNALIIFATKIKSVEGGFNEDQVNEDVSTVVNEQKNIPEDAKIILQQMSREINSLVEPSYEIVANLINQSAKEIQILRQKTQLASKTYSIISDGLTAAIETAFRCAMLFFCGMRIINGQPLSTGEIADMVWLNTMTKTAKDAYKTFNNYVRDIRTFETLGISLDRLLGTYPKEFAEKIRAQANTIYQNTYFQEPNKKALFFALVPLFTYGFLSHSVSYTIAFELILGHMGNPYALAFAALTSIISIISYRNIHSYESLSVEGIDASTATTILTIALLTLACITLIQTKPSILLGGAKSIYIGVKNLLANKFRITNYSIVLTSSISATFFIGYIAHKALELTHSLIQLPIFIAEVLLVFTSQALAKTFHYICYFPELVKSLVTNTHQYLYSQPSYAKYDLAYRALMYTLAVTVITGVSANPYFLFTIYKPSMIGVLTSIATLLTKLYFQHKGPKKHSPSVLLIGLVYTACKYLPTLLPVISLPIIQLSTVSRLIAIIVAYDSYLHNPISAQYDKLSTRIMKRIPVSKKRTAGLGIGLRRNMSDEGEEDDRERPGTPALLDGQLD